VLIVKRVGERRGSQKAGANHASSTAMRSRNSSLGMSLRCATAQQSLVLLQRVAYHGFFLSLKGDFVKKRKR
jgi:hypothetical protein